MSTEEKNQWGWVPKEIGCTEEIGALGFQEKQGSWAKAIISAAAEGLAGTGGLGGDVSPEARLAQSVSRHPNSARYHELLKEIGDLHDLKQRDYGRGDDPFANVRSSQEWGVAPWIGALIRLNDKVKRLQAFAIKGSLANESVDDSLRDISVYALISLVLYEQESKEKSNGSVNSVRS